MLGFGPAKTERHEMQIDLLNIEINPTDGQYGASVLCVTNLDGHPRSLFGMYWYDRTVYASVAFLTFTWVCPWGYKPNAGITGRKERSE